MHAALHRAEVFCLIFVRSHAMSYSMCLLSDASSGIGKSTPILIPLIIIIIINIIDLLQLVSCISPSVRFDLWCTMGTLTFVHVSSVYSLVVFYTLALCILSLVILSLFFCKSFAANDFLVMFWRLLISG